jgi:hypothetical protein
MKVLVNYRAVVIRLRKYRLAWALLLGVTILPALYVLAYAVQIKRGEQRARSKGVNDYRLVFSDLKNEKYESLACAFFWPIYSLDSIYADERLYPEAMIPKCIPLNDYFRHCKCCLLDCVGLN